MSNTYRIKFFNLLSETLASPQWHPFKGESCEADCQGYNGWAPTCSCGTYRCEMAPQGELDAMTLFVKALRRVK